VDDGVEQEDRGTGVDQVQLAEQDEERDQGQDQREHLHHQQQPRVPGDRRRAVPRQRVAGERGDDDGQRRAAEGDEHAVAEVGPERGPVVQVPVVGQRQGARDQSVAAQDLLGALERVDDHRDDGQVD
jgi:hypothetical protein